MQPDLLSEFQLKITDQITGVGQRYLEGHLLAGYTARVVSRNAFIKVALADRAASFACVAALGIKIPDLVYREGTCYFAVGAVVFDRGRISFNDQPDAIAAPAARGNGGVLQFFHCWFDHLFRFFLPVGIGICLIRTIMGKI